MTIELKTKFFTEDGIPYVEIPCQCGELYIRKWKGAGKYKCSKCKKEIQIVPVQKIFKTSTGRLAETGIGRKH